MPLVKVVSFLLAEIVWCKKMILTSVQYIENGDWKSFDVVLGVIPVFVVIHYL